MAVFGIAVALLVVLSLVLLGAFRGGAGGAGKGMDFRDAWAIASPVANRYGGGYLDLATGYDLSHSTVEPFDFAGNGCAIASLVGPYPQEVLIPAFGGDLMSGTAPVWWFWIVDQATTSVLNIYVVNGTVTLAFDLSGAGCLAVDTSTPPLPSKVIDSPAAMAVAARAGAENFTTAHPTGVSLTIALANLMSPAGFGNGEASWVVYLTTGSALFTSPPGSGCSEFSVGVNATSGVPGTPSTYSC